MAVNTENVHSMFSWVCRVFGIISAVGFFGLFVELAYYKVVLSVYFLFVALLVFSLEVVLLIGYYIAIKSPASPRDLPLGYGYKWRCCRLFLYIDNWKRGLLYIALSIFCFVPKAETFSWLSVVLGTLLVSTGLLYCGKSILLCYVKRTSSAFIVRTYNRYEEGLGDDFDANIDPEMSEPLPINETIADQDHILDV